MEARRLKVTRTSRYFISAVTSETEIAWICLHGYGQLASEFYQRLQCLSDKRTLLVCPEGLSRFYTKGGAGPVGSSWMTKEAREDEINDYCLYLDQVYEEVQKLAPRISEVNVLGFSQGAATVSRWCSVSEYNFKRLVLWGAVFPPDMNAAVSGSAEKYLFAGLSDKYLSEEVVFEMSAMFDHVVRYDGGHEVDCSILRANVDLHSKS